MSFIGRLVQQLRLWFCCCMVFPASSFQYRELIPRLADKYRVIAPDLPGFGFTGGYGTTPVRLHIR